MPTGNGYIELVVRRTPWVFGAYPYNRRGKSRCGATEDVEHENRRAGEHLPEKRASTVLTRKKREGQYTPAPCIQLGSFNSGSPADEDELLSVRGLPFAFNEGDASSSACASSLRFRMGEAGVLYDSPRSKQGTKIFAHMKRKTEARCVDRGGRREAHPRAGIAECRAAPVAAGEGRMSGPGHSQVDEHDLRCAAVRTRQPSAIRRLLRVAALAAALAVAPAAHAQEEPGEMMDDSFDGGEAVEAAKEILARKLPEGATREQEIKFLLDRERAAFAVGSSRLRLEALRRLVELTSGTPQASLYRGALWREEWRSGNTQRAFDMGEQLVSSTEVSLPVRADMPRSWLRHLYVGES